MRIPSLVLVPTALAFFGWADPVRAADPAVVAPVKTCADLKTLDLSRGGDVAVRIDSADEIKDGARTFCAVKGYVQPQVNFEVRLPLANWSQRYLQLGCGGYCGGVSLTVPSAARQSRGCAPVEDGTMVVASSDLGHRRAGTFFADGVWAIGNPAAVVEFAYAANHKTALAAKALIRAFYGQPPRYSYFNGCSDGGRQGLVEAQRFPEDFDGIVAGSTTLDVTTTNTFWHAWNVRSNTGPDGKAILKASRIAVLHDAVMKACAGADGLIADPRACAFDVSSILCKSEQSDANCLTEPEASVARRIWGGPVDETGAHLFPGGMQFGSELGWIGSMVPKEDDLPQSPATSGDAMWSWDFPRFMSALGRVTETDYRNMAFTRAEFDRLTQLSTLYDPTNPDLARFAQRGGKLVMWHGWADTGSSPRGSLNYAESVRALMGARAASDFLSLYLVPGAYHCSAGPTPVAADYLSKVMAWVEEGLMPGEIKVGFEAGPNDATVTKTIGVQPYYATPASLSAANRTDWVGLANYRPSVQTWCEWQGGSLVCRPR